jgi:hypothetical protein
VNSLHLTSNMGLIYLDKVFLKKLIGCTYACTDDENLSWNYLLRQMENALPVGTESLCL